MHLLWVASLRVVAASSSAFNMCVAGLYYIAECWLYCVTRVLPPVLPRDAKNTVPIQSSIDRMHLDRP